MKPEILTRIRQLGGHVDNVTGQSLAHDLLAIHFDTVLYPKPASRPWAIADEVEPIVGIGDFIRQNAHLVRDDKAAFYGKLIGHYYRNTDEGFGQFFYKPRLFTPFKEGTPDFDEWNVDFTDEELVDLSAVSEVTQDATPDFVQVFYNYGFPDHFYVCLSDPDPENPTVFSTDHEVFFNEITNEGPLDAFLETFMTKDDLIERISQRLET